MGKFASASKQAASVIKEIQGNTLKSVGTARNYEQALTRVAEYAKSERLEGGLRGMTPEQATTYLETRGEEVGQKTLDMERQAIQFMMQNVTHQLSPGERLTVIQAEYQQALDGRAYAPEQIQAIASAQQEHNSLATQIAYAAGLRAHELLTLERREDREPSPGRPANTEKFDGRQGATYTVEGKGGLIREVVIPHPLAEKLEERRLETPMSVVDRGVNYASRYDIAGGKNWSNSFSSASNRTLGFSTGAHGCRHSYAQERMEELRALGHSYEKSLQTVSQELGHFRSDITEVYLR